MGKAADDRDFAASRAADAPSVAPRAEPSWRRALRFGAPAGLAALVAALSAMEGGLAQALFGAVAGFGLGVGLAALLSESAEAEQPAPGFGALERRGEAAVEAAALVAGPAASLAEALSDARLILERLPLAVLLLDARGRVVFSNPEAEREIGRRILGEHYAAALRAPALAEAVRIALENRVGEPEQDVAEVEFTQRRFQERRLHALVRALAPSSPLGAEFDAAEIHGHARVVVVLQDQTGMRRAEQLHRDFVANASHELKTPLASIAGFVETLRGPAKDDEVARERFLRIVAQQAERMRRLVEDLLSLNRIELNEHVPPRETLDLAALVAQTAEMSPEFEEGRISVDLAGAPRPAMVRGDAAQLEQVFVNLVENALKYGGDRKPIRIVAATRDAPRWQIGVTVEDFGPGIPKEHIPRLTERFYRVGDQPGKLKSGTGLGLSIVKHAVSRHRGQLEIDSRLGRGSRFTVWLPTAEAFDGAPSAP